MRGVRYLNGSPFWLILPLTLLLVSCTPKPEDSITLATGVNFYRDREAGIQLLDVYLQTATAKPILVAGNTERRRNNFIGDCKTVQEWAEEYRAIGGINGGFFGDMYDQLGRRKQIVGLAVVDGKVIAPANFVESTRYPGQKFLRSALGLTAGGLPEIAYATSTLRGPIRKFKNAVNPTPIGNWDVRYAVGCGPRLFVSGEKRITDRDERLVSAGKFSRSFVAYDVDEDGLPLHFVMGRADAMEFSEVADYLESFFSRVHSRRPYEAMCLDGGPSSQIVYRRNGSLEDAEPTGVLVPTALLLVPR